MIYKKNTLIYILSLIFISACGGGGTSSNEKTSDTASAVILQTGQTSSYDFYGNTDNQGLIKDDGYYKSGKTKSYSKGVDNTIRDNVTGLSWHYGSLKVGNGYIGHDTLSFKEAKNYCGQLNIGGYKDWRLPNYYELIQLVNYGRTKPAINSIFGDIAIMDSSFIYWMSSSDKNIYNTGINFTVGGSDGVYFDENFYFCTRGKEIKPAGNIIKTTKNTVTDKSTGLMWQDEKSIKNNWQEAIEYCNSLNLNEYHDWRLPSVNELISIYSDQEMATTFKNQNIGLWTYISSTTFAGNSAHAWAVDSTNVFQSPKLNKYLVICVRN